MNTHIGLFFPYLYFPSDAWVKLSALYWDKIYRIVPSRFPTAEDTTTVTEFAKGKNRFIDNLHPEDFYDELFVTNNSFMRLIENHGKELVKKYGVERHHNLLDTYYSKTNPQRDLVDIFYPQKYLQRKRLNIFNSRRYPKGGNSNLSTVLMQKIETMLRHHLVDAGLARFASSNNQDDDYGMLEMHPKLLNVYMAALAEALANRPPFFASLITSDPINYFAVSGFSFERLAQILLEDVEIAPKNISQHEIESNLAFLVLKCVIPENLADVSIEKILALRERFKGEMGHFQDFVQNIVDELPNITEAQSSPFVNDFLENQYEKKVRPKLVDLEDTMNSLGIKTIESFLNLEIKIPSLLTSLGLATIDPILGATSGLGFGLFKTYSDIKERRRSVEKELRNSDVTYLLRVKEELDPIKSLNWLKSRARKAMFGV